MTVVHRSLAGDNLSHLVPTFSEGGSHDHHSHTSDTVRLGCQVDQLLSHGPGRMDLGTSRGARSWDVHTSYPAKLAA